MISLLNCLNLFTNVQANEKRPQFLKLSSTGNNKIRTNQYHFQNYTELQLTTNNQNYHLKKLNDSREQAKWF